MVSSFNISSKDFSKITRLGRKKEDGTPRPILVSMSSQDVKKKIMRNPHSLRSSDSNISMNHDMTKTEREETNILVDKTREMDKQDHMGEWLYKVRGSPWEKKIQKIRKVNLQKNKNNVTYQYTSRNVSLNKLFCMYSNADCLSNKLNELKSVINSCDTHPKLIGVCEIKPKNFRFAPSTTEFSLPGYSFSILMLTSKTGEVYPFMLVTS